MYTEILFDNDVIAATPDRCMKSWEVITSDIHVAALSKDNDLYRSRQVYKPLVQEYVKSGVIPLKSPHLLHVHITTPNTHFCTSIATFK